MPELVNPLATKHKAFLVKDGEDYGAIIDSTGNCKSGGSFVMAEIYWQETADAIRAVTGMEMTSDRLKQMGERIYNLMRCYNALHGITSRDDTLPWRFTQVPSTSGNARGSVCHLDRMLPDYYRLRGWDPQTGLPSAKTLQRLGLKGINKRVRTAEISGESSVVYQRLGWSPPYTGPEIDKI